MKKSYRLANLIIILLIILTGCGEKKKHTFYDEVAYYHSDYYKIPGPPENTARYEVYYFNFVKEKNKINYENLSQFGFVKNEINSELSIQIENFFTDHNPGEYFADPRCLNCYQDIMLFYKNKKLIGVAKFDFKCDKYYYTNFLSNKKIYLKRDCGKYQNLFNN
ncbi:hypothetical protein ACFFLS_03545 [Flavobacterium procerum]|uniref:Lipoprotein n=1 Tax=Flavobacterium procerum TaxID=1455569 RepID=A0ABV6BKX7_9FLAO